MRSDFEALPDFAKKKLLDMLGAPGTKERDWRERVLLDYDSIPDQPPVSAQGNEGIGRASTAGPADIARIIPCIQTKGRSSCQKTRRASPP